MDKTVKRIGCSNLKTLIENDQILTNDYNILQELQRFAKLRDSWAAEEGNDDLVMCLVMFAWLQDQGYVRELTDVDARKRIRDMHQKQIEDEARAVGFRDIGDIPEDTTTHVISDKSGKNWLFPELANEIDMDDRFGESDPFYGGSGGKIDKSWRENER